MNGTISACLVVYNEGKLLKRCLESIQGLVDEIIVVHDGVCHDDTLDIAAKYNAKVFIRKHGGRCEKHRVFSFEQSTSEWILMIDADEYINKKDIKRIKQLVKRKDVDLYAFRWPIYDGKDYIPGVYDRKTKPVLARKSNMYYIAVTHEYLATYGKSEERKDITLEHKPDTFSYTFLMLQKKLKKWTEIQAQDIVHLDHIDMYNMRNRTTNPHYRYYSRFRMFPLFMTIKLIGYDMYQTGIKEGLWHSSWKNWQIFFIKLITYYYLWMYVMLYKKK